MSEAVHPLGDPDHRWLLEAALRQAVRDLESGAHVALVCGQINRALAVIEAGIRA